MHEVKEKSEVNRAEHFESHVIKAAGVMTKEKW